MRDEHRPLDARRAAYSYLLKGESDNRVRRLAAEDVDPRERGLFIELVSGIARNSRLLETILESFVTRPLSKTPHELRLILQIGAYQALFLDGVPDYALVATAVELVPRRLGEAPRRFVNGVLRSLLRGRRVSRREAVPNPREFETEEDRVVEFDRDVFPDPRQRPEEWAAVRRGFSLESHRLLTGSMKAMELEVFLRLAASRPRFTIRLHPLRTTRHELLECLSREGVLVEPHSEQEDQMIWPIGSDPASTSAFREGLYSVQGTFAARVAPLLEPAPGEEILDLCAGPGGKTIHIADLTSNRAKITACAYTSSTHAALRENLARVRAGGVEVVQWDGEFETLPRRSWDAVLLDVPCSNSGVLARRPEARRHLTRDAVMELVNLQRRILFRTCELLSRAPRPVRIVYATCSVLEEEGRQVVTAALEAFPGLELVREIRSIPTSVHEDGGHAALLRLRGNP